MRLTGSVIFTVQVWVSLTVTPDALTSNWVLATQGVPAGSPQCSPVIDPMIWGLSSFQPTCQSKNGSCTSPRSQWTVFRVSITGPMPAALGRIGA